MEEPLNPPDTHRGFTMAGIIYEFVGLRPEARALVQEVPRKAKKRITYYFEEDGFEKTLPEEKVLESPTIKKIIGYVADSDEEMFPLHQWTLSTGRKLQEEEWHRASDGSGRVYIFTALRDLKTKCLLPVSIWSKYDMNLRVS